MAPSHLESNPAFLDIMAARLLDVDMFAGLSGPDGHQGVPVIRRGDGDGVHVAVFECAADILDEEGSGPVADLIESAVIGARIRVDQVADFNALHPDEGADVGATATVEAGNGDTDSIVRA